MTEKRKTNRWLTWLVVGLTLLVAYPLSAGPVGWMFRRGLLPMQSKWQADVFYYPLGWLVNNDIEPFASGFVWYVFLWL
jgi:hypothetical protein